LLLIPEIGTIRTFLLFSGVLYAVGLVGLWRKQGKSALIWLWMPIAIGALTVVVVNGPLRAPFAGLKLIYEKESAYNYIQVQEDSAGDRFLFLNEGQGIHSQWRPNTASDNHRTWSFFLTVPYFNAPPEAPSNVDSLLIIGLAAGTIARQYTDV